jgi:hypothetical protein
MIRKTLIKKLFPSDFRLKIIAFWVAIWAFFNGMNGTILFLHDIDITYLDGSYYLILGIVRWLIMFIGFYIAIYLWVWDNKIIIYKWKEIKGDKDADDIPPDD